ncbi:hypothetical protein N7536_002880 [Penicillium majusculum]|nr:hypothetical protein N7536_002880 [Penicillium majusculum]
MTKSRGLANPKLTDFVALLVRESDWDQWKQLLEIALNGKDFTFWGILTGVEKRLRDLTSPASAPNLRFFVDL